MRPLTDDDPRHVGHYTLVGRLGSGAMGTVYLGRSRGGRRVAVKLVSAGLAEESSFRDRFRHEVANMRRVGGFWTAGVVDADPDAPRPWVATEYIEGPTLAEYVQDKGPLSEDEVFALGAALAEALVSVHEVGVVHRDLKPGNILISGDGPRVIDFGISRVLDPDHPHRHRSRHRHAGLHVTGAGRSGRGRPRERRLLPRRSPRLRRHRQRALRRGIPPLRPLRRRPRPTPTRRRSGSPARGARTLLRQRPHPATHGDATTRIPHPRPRTGHRRHDHAVGRRQSARAAPLCDPDRGGVDGRGNRPAPPRRPGKPILLPRTPHRPETRAGDCPSGSLSVPSPRA